MQCGGGGALVEGGGRLLLQPVQSGYLRTHTHTCHKTTFELEWRIVRAWPFGSYRTGGINKSDASHLVAPSAEQVVTHGVVVSQGESSVQMLLNKTEEEKSKTQRPLFSEDEHVCSDFSRGLIREHWLIRFLTQWSDVVYLRISFLFKANGLQFCAWDKFPSRTVGKSLSKIRKLVSQ